MIDTEKEVLALHALKARYCRATDTKNWDLFRQCVTEDFSARFEGMPRPSRDLPDTGKFSGRESIISVQSSALEGIVTVHQAYLPEITIVDSHHAHGVWAFRDHLRWPTCTFTGFGHYHEDYVKIEDAWRIAKMVVTRLLVDEEWH